MASKVDQSLRENWLDFCLDFCGDEETYRELEPEISGDVFTRAGIPITASLGKNPIVPGILSMSVNPNINERTVLLISEFRMMVNKYGTFDSAQAVYDDQKIRKRFIIQQYIGKYVDHREAKLEERNIEYFLRHQGEIDLSKVRVAGDYYIVHLSKEKCIFLSKLEEASTFASYGQVEQYAHITSTRNCPRLFMEDFHAAIEALKEICRIMTPYDLHADNILIPYGRQAFRDTEEVDSRIIMCDMKDYEYGRCPDYYFPEVLEYLVRSVVEKIMLQIPFMTDDCSVFFRGIGIDDMDYGGFANLVRNGQSDKHLMSLWKNFFRGFLYRALESQS